MDALFGHTGFVGSFLKENLSHKTTSYFNSNNIRSAKGRAYKNVYCACIPGSKWKANQDPDGDMKNIEGVLEVFKTIKCESIVLISTIDVHDHGYPMQDEKCKYPSSEPYGKNRLFVEKYLRDIFGDKLLIVRLPALFGVGLKKNVIFDLLNSKLLGNINSNSAYQWYPLHMLWTDISRGKNFFSDGQEKVLNIYPVPIETSDIIGLFFPEHAKSVKFGDRVHYNQGSMYGNMFSYTQGVILAEMDRFIRMYQNFWLPGSASNRLVVSNMAWDPVDDHHAIFLLKRYNISNVEIMPSKYFSWETTFANPTFHEKFVKAGINVYSIQSVLYGVEGDFFNNPTKMEKSLKNILGMCDKLGISKVVMGSPKKRVIPKIVNRESEESYENKLSEVLKGAQKGYKARLCLEPNATVYGCDIGKNLEGCVRIAEGTGVGLNFDTGNFVLENDQTGLVNGVEHCQVSAPMLRPLRNADYVGFRSSMAGYHLKNLDKDVKISLEIKVDRIENLGEHLRRFVTYMSEYV